MLKKNCFQWWAFAVATGAACGVLPGRAGAQGNDHVWGVIVSVRGDILQVRPHFNTKLTRLVLDDKTTVFGSEPIKMDQMQPGVRIYARGNYDDKGGLIPRFVALEENPDGKKSRGISSDGYGKNG